MRMPNILFVDDDQNMLAALRRVLNPYRGMWNINFVTSGISALDFMATNTVDVVVTDMAMPEMDGKSLVYRLHEAFPDTIPIILSGHWDIATSLRELGPHVRFLAKPINHDLLVWALREAIAEARLSVSTLLEIAPSAPRNPDTVSTPPDEMAPSWLSLHKAD